MNSVLDAECTAKKNNGETLDVEHSATKMTTIFRTTDLKEWIAEHVDEPINEGIEDFQEQDPGWSLHSILNLSININK